MNRPCLFLLMLLAGLLVACQPRQTASPPAPTPRAFPTATPGVALRGVVDPRALAGPGVLNPATAVALGSQPTATPDASACPGPVPGERLADDFGSSEGIVNEIIRFLTAGGTPIELERGLLDDWGLLGENGYVRSDIDLTGEGQAEVIIGYTIPEQGGALLVAGCSDRRYTALYTYTATGADVPTISHIGDMNRDLQNDLMLSDQICDPEDPDDCTYQTLLVTWEARRARFVNLLAAPITSEDLPTITDIDGDEISEIAVRQESTGNATTGPLRTGLNIYDWNGFVFVLSIVEPDPPDFRIQVLHEADRNLIRGQLPTAIQLYQQSINDDTLRAWWDDEIPLLRAFSFYRLLTAQAASGASNDDLLLIFERIVEAFPDPEQNNVYLEMVQIFYDSFQVTQDAEAACAEVRNFAAGRPEALDLLNRYGSNSPTYTLPDLCPFGT